MCLLVRRGGQTAGEPFGPQDPAALTLEGLVTALYVIPGFVILAVAARWMSLVGAGVTLLLMIVLSVWTSPQM